MRLFRWERNFGYRCVLTCAQIELMQSDLPHTLYNFKKDKGEKKPHHVPTNEELNTVADDEVIRLQEEANRKTLERRAAKERGEIPYESTDELFNG